MLAAESRGELVYHGGATSPTIRLDGISLMKNQILGLLCITLFACSGTVMAEQKLYLALGGEKRVDVFDVDDATGSLTKTQSVALPANPGPMALAPGGKFVYVAMTSRDGNKQVAEIATLKRDSGGRLEFLAKGAIPSRAPYVTAHPDGGFLLTAHYGSGRTSVMKLEDGVYRGKVVDEDETAKNAHCIVCDRSGGFVFVPHTGPNRVYQFRFDRQSGQLSPNDPPFVAGPPPGNNDDEPRHIVQHPQIGNRFYTSNERGGGVTAWAFDLKKGTITKLQTLSSLPKGYDKPSAAADIQITPNARFVYVSNRDVAKSERGDDSLAGFRLDKSGGLTAIGQFPTERFPRSFCIDATGRYIYSAGQRSGTLGSFQIDQQSGELKPLKSFACGQVPIWVMCVESK